MQTLSRRGSDSMEQEESGFVILLLSVLASALKGVSKGAAIRIAKGRRPESLRRRSSTISRHSRPLGDEKRKFVEIPGAMEVARDFGELVFRGRGSSRVTRMVC